MKNIWRYAHVFMFVLAPGPSLSAEKGRLTLAGSSTLQPAMEVEAQRFESLHPGVQIDVQGGGSSVGVSAPEQGLADIGMVSRDLRDDELKTLVPTPVALDGLAVIVHAENPLREISKSQVIDVYTGLVKTWKDLGGRNASIVVINKEEGRATLELFEKYFDLKGKVAKNAVIIGPNGQAVAAVAGNRDAIAYVSIGSATVAESEGTPIRRLILNGVAPSVENVKNGKYGLRRTLNLTTVGRPKGWAADFIRFVLGPDGQKILLEWDFVPLGKTAR